MLYFGTKPKCYRCSTRLTSFPPPAKMETEMQFVPLSTLVNRRQSGKSCAQCVCGICVLQVQSNEAGLKTEPGDACVLCAFLTSLGASFSMKSL